MTEEMLTTALKAVQIYAESHPRPSSVTIGQAAEMLGISRKTLAGRIKDGWMQMNGLGKIPTSEIDRVLATTRKLHKMR